MTRFDVVTLFPEMFEALTASGVSRRAYQQQLFELNTWNPRVFTEDRHKTVDDRPYGGGPGMVMMYPPLKKTVDAINQAVSQPGRVVYLSPQGAPLTQQKLIELQAYDHLTLVCGRYEGIDERFITHYVDEEVCVGDFVVSGGELPAMMLMDALIRLIPGALGHDQSAEQDSFADGLLDCPHYTRPVEVDGLSVPDVLQQGNHAKIAAWRHQQKLLRTQQKRPDLFAVYQASVDAD
ncbi:MAG: tRNA (guanosine(37)-N1)-methyltransferase TrmD [Piscirickettsiaceae bacterium CG_4_9_14_3_um_filter_43_564]|nr:tRNA (guanosine(37)-N1)-methyltransferase TrmD [Thiomicrospira sp.]OIP96783.1 MAG: tRNA (guanosine(37)-N1)-methyltransferase TrmD [Thiomicrospira sp. CG2_30_44_34]PIQ04676.1 MAG: tRNA (guanosine(37)-N1)-methyltransferase TrmD [Piscirickettsiaceae bacterium CG18_big_fil_WC_8_21_14_2_50_44_103]PIU39386.1 MAG: tRNA (guanosine(37)-N1)-methyltransferase TrmD [Piscirickettsiaceae bacterium CG07_land_8_20_14_0_80_44_28]PIW56767.1 MAG: tRNA (guanosine(37)-N1)-methyltransferase TrmD [Piscirickettsiac